MERAFQGNWMDISVMEYVFHVGPVTRAYWIGNVVEVDRLGNFITRFPLQIIEGIFHISQTGTHTCNITSPEDWLSFVDSSYSLGCRDCGNEGWRAINGRKLTFREWMTSPEAVYDSHQFTFDDTRFSNNVICTVFDTIKQKNLIVDGLHRARALTLACDGGRTAIPTVTVIECFGQRVDIMFPCDVHQLPLT